MDYALVWISILGAIFVYLFNDLSDKQKQLSRLHGNLISLKTDITRLLEQEEKNQERLEHRSRIASVKYQAIRDEFNNIKGFLAKHHDYKIRKNLILDNILLDDTLTEDSDTSGFYE